MMTDMQFARLVIELDKHPHKDEITELMHQQIDDENSVRYLSEDADTISN